MMTEDAEEIILFPDLPRPPAPTEGPPVSSDELLGTFGEPALAPLREWLTIQMGTLDNRMRRHKASAKPPGITPEIAAYIQAREEYATFKAGRDAYMKAVGKLDHYAKQALE